MLSDQPGASQIQVQARRNAGNQQQLEAFAGGRGQQPEPPRQGLTSCLGPLVVLGEDENRLHRYHQRRHRNRHHQKQDGCALPDVFPDESVPGKASAIRACRLPVPSIEPRDDHRNQETCCEGISDQPEQACPPCISCRSRKCIEGEMGEKRSQPQRQANNQRRPTRPRRPVPVRRRLIVECHRIPRQERRHCPCHDHSGIPDRLQQAAFIQQEYPASAGNRASPAAAEAAGRAGISRREPAGTASPSGSPAIPEPPFHPDH